MRSLVVLPEDRPCAPCEPVLPPARPKGYCRPLPPARRRPPSAFWRRFKTAIGALAIAALIGGGLYIWLRTDLPQQVRAEAQILLGEAGAMVDMRVGEVNVIGRQHTPIDLLIDAVGVERGDPILAIDLDAVRKRVEQLGWVSRAAVWRQLPDTLHIEITEREPFARWQIDGEVRLISREGRVLQQGDHPEYGSLLRLVGPGAADKAQTLIVMLETEPVLGNRVVNAVRVRNRRWDLEFDNGITAKLPEENPEAAWIRLVDLERRFAILRRDIQAVDLRLDDRLIVKMNPEADAPNATGGGRKPAGKRV